MVGAWGVKLFKKNSPPQSTTFSTGLFATPFACLAHLIQETYFSGPLHSFILGVGISWGGDSIGKQVGHKL